MKKLLSIFFVLLTATGYSQYVTVPAVVEDTTKLKAYAGSSGLLLVVDSAYQGWYVKCTGCTVDHAKTFSGVGTRKWTRIVVPEIEDALNANQGVWGSFTGDLSDQTDLVDTLDVYTDSLAAHRTDIDGKQDINSNLTAIIGLSPSNNDIIQRKSGAWTNRTMSQLKTDLSLSKSDVGLSNVDNTSDAAKPISTLTQTALDGKQDALISGTNLKTINSVSLLGGGDIPISIPTRVFLGSDVVNSTTSFASITGLQFPVVAGEKYEFRFFIVYNSAATTTGAAFSINGPTLNSTNYVSTATISTTSRYSNVRAGYNVGTETSNSISSNNIAIIEGVIECGASGNVVATFKSGVAASAITVKAGNSYVSYSKIN
jgi:hypothetical protein